MFKKDIGLPIAVFAFLTVKQLIFNSEIHWINNAGFSVFFYLFYIFWEWTKTPYKWNEKKKKDSVNNSQRS
ncbi:hypothetical protein WMZ97_20795 [Lentibacillus sp. N15]|uniref:hypothetical protein n=1 Tax=Lentibacillus songyuanensis TaxID=3136161 RepID=UPI0031B9C526